MGAVASELRRKSIHLIGLVVPIVYWITDFNRGITLLFIAIFSFAFTISEIYRIRYGIPLKEAETLVKPLIRPQERRGVGAHVFFAAGAFVTILAYPKDIAIAAMLISTFADGSAAVVGKRWGRHSTIGKKTLEGTLALVSVAFVVALIVLAAFFGHVITESIAIAFAGAIAAASVELLPINDNLSIPIAAGFAMYIALHSLKRS